MKTTFIACTLSALSISSAFATPTSLLFSKMTEEDVNHFLKGEDEVTVEFRRDDVLPLEILVSGNLLESAPESSAKIKVKQGFFIRVTAEEKFLMSLDGYQYTPIFDLITGSLKLNASSPSPSEPIEKLTLELNTSVKSKRDR